MGCEDSRRQVWQGDREAGRDRCSQPGLLPGPADQRATPTISKATETAALRAQREAPPEPDAGAMGLRGRNLRPDRGPGAWPQATAKEVTLRLLDGLSLAYLGRPLSLQMSTQKLLGYVSLYSPVGRGGLCGVLWPDAADARVRASLRTALWSLNTLAPDFVAANADTVRLGAGVKSQLETFSRRAHAILNRAMRRRAGHG